MRGDARSACAGPGGRAWPRAVGDHRDVRSGGFAAGNFGFGEQQFAAAYRQAGHTEVKTYRIPLHVSQMPGLTVHEALLARRPVTRIYQRMGR